MRDEKGAHCEGGALVQVGGAEYELRERRVVRDGHAVEAGQRTPEADAGALSTRGARQRTRLRLHRRRDGRRAAEQTRDRVEHDERVQMCPEAHRRHARRRVARRTPDRWQLVRKGLSFTFWRRGPLASNELRVWTFGVRVMHQFIGIAFPRSVGQRKRNTFKYEVRVANSILHICNIESIVKY